MEDGKLYVIITDKRPSDQQGNGLPGGTDKRDNQKSLQNWISDKFYDVIKDTVKNTVNFTVNNIGNFTGSYENQRIVQNAVQLSNRLLNIGTAAMGGFVATGFNPIGAIVGASIAVINQGIQVGEEYLSTKSQQARYNMKVNKLKERSGLYSLGDGSRGTMD